MNHKVYIQKEKDRIFTAIYAEYFDYVSKTIRKQINDYDTAQDIAQNIFIHVYNNITAINNIKSWLHHVIRLQLLQFYKKKKIQRTCELYTKTLYTHSTHETDIDSTLVLKDIVEATSLNEYESVVIQLAGCYKEKLTVIAQQLQTTRRKIKIMYDNIIRRLRYYFKQCGIHHIWDII